jgi:hypothetical protein
MPHKPRKPPAAEAKPAPVVPLASQSLDEIIEERTANVPPGQAMDVALEVVREALMSDVPLTGMDRLFVALTLECLLPPKKRAVIERQRLLRSIEDALVTAKWARKNVWPKHGRKGERRPAAIEAVRQVIFRNPDDFPADSRFPTVEALEQFIKRERREKKKRERR